MQKQQGGSGSGFLELECQDFVADPVVKEQVAAWEAGSILIPFHMLQELVEQAQHMALARHAAGLD